MTNNILFERFVELSINSLHIGREKEKWRREGERGGMRDQGMTEIISDCRCSLPHCW
jgi:hypothetical protein